MTSSPSPDLTVAGLDHVVIIVDDLDRAASDWAALGFTLSPRGEHSAHIGTRNHTLMLGPDYLELLAVAQPTEANAPSRAFLAQHGEGLERLAMRTLDAAADVTALRAAGLAARGPVDFSRPVTRADGSRTEASFSVFHWPDDIRIGALRLFACQHHTPAAVWLPELQQHRNGARRILRIEQIVADPKHGAETLGHLLGRPPQALAGGAARGWRIATGPGRADIDFLEADGQPPATRLVLAVDADAESRPGSRQVNGLTVVFEVEA